MDTFVLGAQIASGAGALDKLLELSCDRAAVVCDPFMAKSGASHQVTDRLDKIGCAWELFDRVVPDPTVDVVSACVSLFMEVRPTCVVALGGGSAIDTAKAASYIYTRTAKVDRPLFVAVPTTSGTGSEVTSFSVISDPAAGVKYPIVSDELLPDHAILDPELTRTVPPTVTADTGLDVLTHALEAYVATDATDMSDALAEKAAAVVFECLEHVVEHGDDIVARERMHNASCMAGVAFNNAGLGLCHAMAHALGAQVHLPHGRCNALLLPHIIRFNAKDPAVCARYARIAARVGCCCHTDVVAVEGLVRKIEQLMRAVHVAPVIEDEERRALAREKIDVMVANAQKDRCMPTNPVSASPEQIAELYRAIC